MKARRIKEGDGTMETGAGRMRITLTTKENDFAECTFERLDDRVELEPVDMDRARRALKNGFREYRRERSRIVEQETKEAKEAEARGEQEETTDVESVLASGFVVDVEKGDTTEGSMEVLEPAVAVIGKEGEDYDE